MSLRRKVLLRIYALIVLMIIAMSATYYYLFTRDIRERSQQSISTALTMILDDFSTKAHDIPLQINQSLENSVSKPLYTLQLVEQELDPADKESALWSVKKSMTYIDAIASRMRDFAGLVEAAEIVIYNRQGKLLTIYRNDAEIMTTGALIPGLNAADAFVTLNPGDRWYATMQTIDEIPTRPLLDNLSTTYAEPVPERSRVELSQFQTSLALKFTTPIIERGELQGICVVQRAIQKKDVARYARLAGAEVNIFAGTQLSVGTLPAFHILPDEQRNIPQELNFAVLPLVPVIRFSEMAVQGTSYYQGTLTFGDQHSQTGAMTIHYPRSLEEKQKKNFVRVVFGIAVIFSVLAVIEALGLSSAIVQPIMRLADAMSEMKRGNMRIVAKVESSDEIGLLADSFNGMITQINDDFHQIDEQRQRLEQQNAELKRLDKMKDQFLSNTSHELRTPLNGIAGLADALLSGVDGPLNTEERKHVRMILQSSKRLSHLVNSLLDFSKIRSQKLELHIRPFPLQEVVEVALAFLRPQADEKGLALRMDFPENLPEVHGDIDKVEQIVTNLLGNAVKFTREGTVTVSARQEGMMVKISVKDTGIGISREAQERIFSPFEQADGSTTREFGGTGLGLAISKELVELHHGEIGVISEPGAGSEFYFTLPAGDTVWEHEASGAQEVAATVVQPPRFIETPALPELEAAFQISGKGRRVLVIDDDPTNVEVLKTQLEHVGFEVWKASDGKEAFDVVNGYTVDLILCDVMMPLVDGYTFAMRMRERENLKNIPLIFVSAKTQKADIVKGYQAGAIDYLTKPVESDELLFKVNAIINAQQHRAAYRTGAVVGLPDTYYETDEDKEHQFAVAQRGNGEKILVVDDEPINVEVIKAHLTQYNYQVITASDGLKALELLEREKPELVLLDLMMPKMSGFKLCKIIRREKGFADLPVIMLTAKSNLYDKIYGLNIGASDYLVKPFDKEELLTRIYVLLSLSALQQQLVETNIGLQAEVVERRQAEEALRQLNEELEERVLARTADLQASLDMLKQTQRQLVQSEKIAALGELVAGMAHEINTPLGVCITAASHLQDRSRDLESHYAHGQMRRSEMERFWQISQQSLEMLMTNLTHISQQIQTFKQVAVNETHVEQRRFAVREMLENALFSIKNDLTAASHRLTISGGESVAMESYPGAFSHVMNSLIMNSLTHAYPSTHVPGELRIDITEADDSIIVRYADNGCGISPEHLSRLFQPFFTTSRGTNTGLGLHIVYNLVTHKMRGNIRCESEVGKGTAFIIELPKAIR